MGDKSHNAIKMLDRISDSKVIDEFIKSDDFSSRCLLIRTQAASGISTFLKYHALKTGKGIFPITVYCDLKNNPIDILDLFFFKHKRKIICKILNLLNPKNLIEWGGIILNYIFSLCFGINIGGVSKKIITPLASLTFSDYETPKLEEFARKVTLLKCSKIIFFIDNAQNDLNRISDLLKLTHSAQYKNVKFVISYAENNRKIDDYAVFKLKIEEQYCHNIIEHSFSNITKELLAELVKDRQLILDESEYEPTIKKSHNNIWKLLTIIDESYQNKSQLSELEKYILRILCIAHYGIKKSDLRQLSEDSMLIHVDGTDIWCASINKLLSYEYIYATNLNDDDPIINISPSNHPILISLNSTDIKYLPIVSQLYEYFNRIYESDKDRLSIMYTIPILYDLSQYLRDNKTNMFAHELVKIAMSKGSCKEAKKYINDAIHNSNLPVQGYFTHLAFYITSIKYDKVMEILNSLPPHFIENYRILKIIYAVALNREREHTVSIEKLYQLVNDEKSTIDEKALCYSYIVAGLLHESREEEAYDCIIKEKKVLTKAKGYGYFLRNVSATLMWGKVKNLNLALEWLEEARSCMVKNQDHYGEATVLTNIGVLNCYQGNLQIGEKNFRDSYDRLKIYGTHHLPEVGVNIGIVLTRMGEYPKAIKWLQMFCQSLERDFPRFLGKNSMALAHYMQGNRIEAFNICQENYTTSDSIELDEAKARALYNYFLLTFDLYGFSNTAKMLYKKIQKNKWLQENRKKTLKIHIRSATISSNLVTLWSYDYCQYWSNNPLTMLPASSLSI